MSGKKNQQHFIKAFLLAT